MFNYLHVELEPSEDEEIDFTNPSVRSEWPKMYIFKKEDKSVLLKHETVVAALKFGGGERLVSLDPRDLIILDSNLKVVHRFVDPDIDNIGKTWLCPIFGSY